MKRPEHGFDEVSQYSQRRADYIDLEANQLVSGACFDLLASSRELPLDLLVSADAAARRAASGMRVITFDRLLTASGFVADMRAMLRILQEAYDYPVDIEFTVNVLEGDVYKINLVQCRPLQVQRRMLVELPEIVIASEDRIIEARSAVVGQSRIIGIDRCIYVTPDRYSVLTIQERYAAARLIGDINRAMPRDRAETVLLIGPGRWGTSSPSLGVPVNFSDINRVTAICEIVAMRDTLIPDVSLGTHFLNELVEMDMLYLALFPDQQGNFLNRDFFENAPNALTKLLPQADAWREVIRVITCSDLFGSDGRITLIADALTQRVVCFRDRTPPDAASAP
jgi:hypothetical protein